MSHRKLISHVLVCYMDTTLTYILSIYLCTIRNVAMVAEAAGFQESVLTCDGLIHKDCSFSFCMSRQGIININKGSSFFSFRKRSKFAKMAEHFEYNHIPAQMSSINHFRVKSVLCFREKLVVLHLSRNGCSQFGVLELRSNKFLGVFGKQEGEFCNEALSGEISMDKSKCLVRMPAVQPPQGRRLAPLHNTAIFCLYDLKSKAMISQVSLHSPLCHFRFDPRFTWRRLAVTNFEQGQYNSLSLVQTDSWQVMCSNQRMTDTHTSLYPYMKDMTYTRNGALIIATILDATCHCREMKTRNYRPIHCSIYVFNGDTTETLHCIQYQRYTCTQHLCPVNYTPVYSICSSRMAVVMNTTDLPPLHYVQVYKLPTPLNLQNMCRIVILQNFPSDELTELPLPPKLINYLHFKPEFD